MHRNAKPRQGGRGLNGNQVSTCAHEYCRDSNRYVKRSLPRLSPLGIVALRRYRGELLELEPTREASGLVDCCDGIQKANEGGRR